MLNGALTYFNNMIFKSPKEAMNHLQKGLILELMGNVKEAQNNFLIAEKVAKQNNSNALLDEVIHPVSGEKLTMSKEEKNYY